MRSGKRTVTGSVYVHSKGLNVGVSLRIDHGMIRTKIIELPPLEALRVGAAMIDMAREKIELENRRNG